MSREGSLTRNCPPQQYNTDRSLRQSTPVPPDRRTVEQLNIASSVGADTRVVDQYGRTSSLAGVGVTSQGSMTMTSQGALSVRRY